LSSNSFKLIILKLKNNIFFKEIYYNYHIMVFNLALQYIQNQEDAEEITQDTFLQIFNSIETFKQNSSLKTWIFRITINKSLDFIKHKNSKKRFFIFGKKYENEFEIQNLTSFEHPDITFENQENTAFIFKVINQLPENQKTAFILSKIEEINNPEIAEIMKLSISAVESLIFRAKSNLKDKLSIYFEKYHKKK
jgi:RNA polymerase sigma factor (sigma-70 family)